MASTVIQYTSHADDSIPAVAVASGYTRAKLTEDALQKFVVPFVDFRVWDAIATNLPGTSASDDLGLYGGTFGTDAPLIRTYDVKNAGAVTLRTRVQVCLPAEYVASGDITLRFHAGMITTVASSTATIDVEAYAADKDGTLGSDLCTTSATTINSLTFAAKDFVITGTGLNPGDWLDVRVTIAVNDSATATAVIAAIGSAELLCDIKG
jgi:hypothetical protein